METLEAREAMLTNREVFEALQADKLERQRDIEQMIKVQKAESKQWSSQGKQPPPWDKDKDSARLILPENVHTVQRAVLDWFSEADLATSKQTVAQIVSLTKALTRFSPQLSKADKLQIVNVMPCSMAELYVTVDDIEARFPSEEHREALLNLVQSHATGADATLAPPAQEEDNLIDTDKLKNDNLRLEEAAEDEMAYQEEMMDESDEEEDLLIGSSTYQTAKKDADMELDEVES